MKLSYQGIQDKQGYAAAQVALPQYDWAKMAEKTAEKPVWVHFGAGNIFRGFIAGLQQRLLNAGLAESGIVAAETFDYDIIDKIYVPHDSMTLMVSLKADGSTQKEVIASIAKGIKAGDLVKSVCALCGGKGGGKPDSAMGGGKDLLKLDDALASVDDFVAVKLGL